MTEIKFGAAYADAQRELLPDAFFHASFTGDTVSTCGVQLSDWEAERQRDASANKRVLTGVERATVTRQQAKPKKPRTKDQFERDVLLREKADLQALKPRNRAERRWRDNKLANIVISFKELDGLHMPARSLGRVAVALPTPKPVKAYEGE